MISKEEKLEPIHFIIQEFDSARTARHHMNIINKIMSEISKWEGKESNQVAILLAYSQLLQALTALSSAHIKGTSLSDLSVETLAVSDYLNSLYDFCYS